jgi:hypothetical protein
MAAKTAHPNTCGIAVQPVSGLLRLDPKKQTTVRSSAI